MLPLFNKMLQVKLTRVALFSFSNIVLFSVLALGSGLLSGAYPAIFLSRMQPSGIFKVQNGGLKMNLSLRKVLIVFQFSVSITLIVATMIVWQQLNLFHNRPLGFNKNHLILLPAIHLSNSPNAFKTKLLDHPNVISASLADIELGGNIGNSSSMSDPSDSTRRLNFGFVYGDFDFLETMGIKLVSGRSFSWKFPGDFVNYDSLYSAPMKKSDDTESEELLYQSPIVVTESVVRALQRKQSAVPLFDFQLMCF
jgi:putative ABC transport system permease protein